MHKNKAHNPSAKNAILLPDSYIPDARFVTQYRRNIFNLDAIEKLCKYFASVGADFDVELVEMDGERDHAHLLINSSQSGYQQANSLKGVSRRKIK
jgi:putative transposase